MVKLNPWSSAKWYKYFLTNTSLNSSLNFNLVVILAVIIVSMGCYCVVSMARNLRLLQKTEDDVVKQSKIQAENF